MKNNCFRLYGAGEICMEDINKNEREYNYNKERERILYEYTRSNKFKEDILLMRAFGTGDEVK